MTAPASGGGEGALSQSIGLTFRFLQLGVVGLAFLWLASGLRSIEPDARALVLRFGKFDRERGPGLLFALPEPLERVEVAPAVERLLTQHVTSLAPNAEPNWSIFSSSRTGLDLRRDGGYVLTGDAGVVHLTADVVYHVADARAWLIGREVLVPTLDRLFCAVAIAACARRTLDGVLVARPDLVDRGDVGPERRDADARDRDGLRTELAAALNERLDALGRRGTPLGIRVERVDVTAQLPIVVAPSFQQVASSRQSAEREIADARTEAERTAQLTESERANLLATAAASAGELVSSARVRTSGVISLAATRDPTERRLLLDRIWSERIEAILGNAQSITAVSSDGARVLLPGVK